MTTQRLLVAEDDRSVRQALDRILRLEGYDVTLVNDGVAALEALSGSQYDAAILDVMMPLIDGMSVCRSMRQRKDRTPVLMLTARHEVRDRVSGLDSGADDYLVKPFAVDELTARVRALLRRSSTDDGQPLVVDDLVLDPNSRRVTRAGVEIELTKTEFDLLEALMAHTGKVLTREVLYERVWGIGFETNSKSLDVYIGYLRKKVDAGSPHKLIQTVRDFGYKISDSHSS